MVLLLVNDALATFAGRSHMGGNGGGEAQESKFYLVELGIYKGKLQMDPSRNIDRLHKKSNLCFYSPFLLP